MKKHHQKKPKTHSDSKHILFPDLQSDEELQKLDKEYKNIAKEYHKMTNHLHELKKKLLRWKKDGKDINELNETINSLSEKAENAYQIVMEKQEEVKNCKHKLGIDTQNSSSPSAKYGF